MTGKTIKETRLYRSEFYVFDCPYCEYKHYLDIEDLFDEHIDGEHFKCTSCDNEFYVTEY